MSKFQVFFLTGIFPCNFPCFLCGVGTTLKLRAVGRFLKGGGVVFKDSIVKKIDSFYHFYLSLSLFFKPLYIFYLFISTLIHKLFIILHSYYILTGMDHVLDIQSVISARIDSSQDYVLRADLASGHIWDVHNKIYSLNKSRYCEYFSPGWTLS